MNSRKNMFYLHLTLMPHQADEEKKEEVTNGCVKLSLQFGNQGSIWGKLWSLVSKLFSVGPNGVTFLSTSSLGIDLIIKGLTQLVTGVVWIFLLWVKKDCELSLSFENSVTYLIIHRNKYEREYCNTITAFFCHYMWYYLALIWVSESQSCISTRGFSISQVLHLTICHWKIRIYN